MFDFLGKISYGMYVFHPFVIVLTAIPLKYVIPHLPGKPFQFIAISLVVVPITILVSKLSFVYFESRFLKLKGKYSNIGSTNEQKQTKIKPKERAAIV
jgi:peptidoglycan/LPS O-acetylase OafA/YrhL